MRQPIRYDADIGRTCRLDAFGRNVETVTIAMMSHAAYRKASNDAEHSVMQT